jgi:hypothetical protein
MEFGVGGKKKKSVQFWPDTFELVLYSSGKLPLIIDNTCVENPTS